MTIADMFGQSAILTLLGMGVVFSFLAILVLAISCTGAVIRSLGVGKEDASPSSGGAASSGAASSVAASGLVFDGAVVAAISAAVKQYRKEI